MHTTYNCISILQYSKTLQQSKHKKKQEKKPVAKQKGNHTEPQKGTRQQNSISQITFRALHVNGLGDQTKGNSTRKN